MASGYALQQSLRRSLGLQQAGHGEVVTCRECRAQVAGADRVNRHPRATQLGPQALQVSDQPGLAGAVRAVARQTAPARNTRHPHQRCGAGLCLHGRQKGLEGGGHTQQVDLQHAAEHGQVIGLRGGVPTGHTGVGDHQVGHTTALHPVVRHGLHGGGIGHVEAVHRAAPGGQSGQHFQLRRVPAHQCHLCALHQQPTRQCLAQAAAGTRQHDIVKSQRHGARSKCGELFD